MIKIIMSSINFDPSGGGGGGAGAAAQQHVCVSECSKVQTTVRVMGPTCNPL